MLLTCDVVMGTTEFLSAECLMFVAMPTRKTFVVTTATRFPGGEKVKALILNKSGMGNSPILSYVLTGDFVCWAVSAK